MRAWAPIILACALAGCCPFLVRAPGKGPTARLYFEQATPIISALESYKARHGRYPASLDDLAPEFIAQVPQVKTRSGQGFDYLSRTGDSYYLMFRYTGPGTNGCSYTPEAQRWKCTGGC